jgi:hypothetical protein
VHLLFIVYIAQPGIARIRSVSVSRSDLVRQNGGTFIGHAQITRDIPNALADQLEEFKRRSQEVEEGMPMH